MTDVVTPPNTTVVSDGNDNHGNAALWALSGDHRLSAQFGTEGRIDGLATTFNLKAIADSESRHQAQFGELKHLIAKEGDATRHCLMQQEIDRLRSENVKLEFRIK